MNKIIESKMFPKQLKEAVVFPMYKTGEKDEVVNYRSILLLFNIAKNSKKLLIGKLLNF